MTLAGIHPFVLVWLVLILLFAGMYVTKDRFPRANLALVVLLVPVVFAVGSMAFLARFRIVLNPTPADYWRRAAYGVAFGTFVLVAGYSGRADPLRCPGGPPCQTTVRIHRRGYRG